MNVNTPTNNQKYINKDAVHLPYINKKLFLTSANGSQQIFSKRTANITIAGLETVQFLKRHPSKYRAYIIAKDTHNISYNQFKRIFSRAAILLNKQLKDDKISEVIVSCHAGINRSVTMILYYLIKYNKINSYNQLKRMIEYIRNQNKNYRGKPALINTTFEKYLYRYLKKN